ncbi:CASTOR/POLLUX-related putative ion channel [Nocardioides lianchengensis]|uniref:TrkA-N domain-containing protein n=1 Tax=Nocardioides lianchengensis TaxID=1045774 RepID=A0A1G6K0W4_9ACTN|nr:NAD-binding protein [Nocardioides lianchengensis]NYG08844.1 voltage-gated potassium channel Kch [Nocardioides lianchengensis]SDC24548.1 TrkA-N domain-containing protein [Nocardioides lianchengensis]
MARTGQQLRRRTAKAVQERKSAGTSPKKGAATPKSDLGDKLRYWFDNSMSRGTPALVAWLSVATLALIVFFTVVTTVFGLRPDDGGVDDGFFRELFQSLFHALDPGTIAGDGYLSWKFLLPMLVLTIGGLFIVSALIGVIAAGIDEKLADLRRGRSLVLETDHTLILGWSDSIFTIVRELTLANESRKKPVVVILADRDKVEMEEQLAAKVPDLRGTRLVCRNGSPMDLDELAVGSPASARSVILLAPDSDDPDAEVIKTLLALNHGVPDPDSGPRIVAEIRDPGNLAAARLVGARRTALLDIRETVAKLVVQTSRQSGAAAVYTELFDYDGDEIYFFEDHGLGGTTYGEAQQFFENASVIGLVGEHGTKLNPPADTLVGPQTLIVVAEDDSALSATARATARPDLDALGEETGTDAHATTAVLIGWNERAAIVLRELDHYAEPGSSLTVVTSYGVPVIPALENLAVSVVQASTTDRAVLESHLVEGLDQVLVLCYSDDLDVQTADARTLVTLLHVRDIVSRFEEQPPIVSEMLDDRNRVLAQVADIDDVVVSGEIVSLIVTQLSEDQRLEGVFGELLGSEGSEIYLRPAEWYVRAGQEVTWATVVAGAVRRGETAIGFKSAALAEGDADFGVAVNPAKSDLLVVEPGDRVVVLAEA